jgi:hypothetical protein
MILWNMQDYYYGNKTFCYSVSLAICIQSVSSQRFAIVSFPPISDMLSTIGLVLVMFHDQNFVCFFYLPYECYTFH